MNDRRILTALVFALPLLLVLLAISASGAVLLGQGEPTVESRLLRGWCGLLLIFLLSDVTLLVMLLGWRAVRENATETVDEELLESLQRELDSEQGNN